MSAIEELHRLIENESLLHRDKKTQYADCDIKNISIWSTNEEFLFAILYDIFDGKIFGINTKVEVLLLVEADKVSSIEMLFCTFIISGLPKFKDIKISSCLEDMNNSDYLILHHEVDWGSQEYQNSRMDVIKHQFLTLKTWGMKINKCLAADCLVLLVGDLLSPARLILGLYCPDFPQRNIHGVTRHYERAATSILANQLKVPMPDIKGVGVFGEDIVESTNSWIEVKSLEHENEVYEDSVMYHKLDVYEMQKVNEKQGGNRISNLRRPLKMFLENEKSSKEHPSKKKLETQAIIENPFGDSTKLAQQCYPPLGIPAISENSPGSYINNWQQIALDRGWLTEGVKGLHDIPQEFKLSTKMYSLLNKKQPVRSLRWVLGRQEDKKFHCYTIPKKCKTEQSGYSLARGISDYLKFILHKSKTVKRTNALVCSSDAYYVPSGMYFSFPVVIKKDMEFRIVKDFRVSDITHMRIIDMVKKLEKEYDMILKLYSEFPPKYEEPKKSSSEIKFGEEEDVVFEGMEHFTFVPEEQSFIEK